MKKGFTLIELLVVIAIIGLLSSVVFASLNSARGKARDARRQADMVQIKKALDLFYDQHGCLPTPTTGASPCASAVTDPNSGSWDTSREGTFLPFLVNAGYFSRVPVDPLNDNTYFYRYYCYSIKDHGGGLHLGYFAEGGAYVKFAPPNTAAGWADSDYACK